MLHCGPGCVNTVRKFAITLCGNMSMLGSQLVKEAALISCLLVVQVEHVYSGQVQYVDGGGDTTFTTSSM